LTIDKSFGCAVIGFADLRFNSHWLRVISH
jgi:hypothetical protein